MFLSWMKRPRTEGQSTYFHSRQVLLRLLSRERLRCDRSQETFSLLTLRLPRGVLRHNLALLEKLLRERLRATDDAGLLEPDSIAILLPATAVQGAWSLADSLEELLTAESISVDFNVEVYPSSDNEPPGEIAEDNDTEDRDTAETLQGSETRQASVDGSPASPLASRFVLRTPLWKRLIDIVGAATGLIVLSPVLLASAAAVRLSSRGPVLYKQRRAGLGGKPFTMYKFRSMIVNADEVKDLLRDQNEQDGPAFKIEHDPRVTRIGRFLRATSFDELPQLWNVLVGHMSLVGPRPLPVEESNACQTWQRRRLDVAPGLTCLWQVEDRRIKIAFSDWMRMDLAYIKSRTLTHDAKLILLTLRTILYRR